MREGGVKSSHIAELMGMPHSTGSTVLTKWKKFGCLTTGKPNPPPTKLSVRSLQDLAREIQQHWHLSLAALARMFRVCRTTIRKHVRLLGFGNRIAPRKPFLSAKHRNQRFTFARKYKHWTAEEWKNVIWTDGSSFKHGKESRCIRVWRKVHEKYDDQCLAPTFKSGRTPIMCERLFTHPW